MQLTKYSIFRPLVAIMHYLHHSLRYQLSNGMITNSIPATFDPYIKIAHLKNMNLGIINMEIRSGIYQGLL